MLALVLAGGEGTRLRPLTETRPKPLMPFMGAPFAEGLLRRLRDAGCARAVFLVGADAAPFEPLRSMGASLGVAVEIATEDRPLGTAGAARRVLTGSRGIQAPGPVDVEGAARAASGAGPVLVCNGDILTDLDFRALVAAHESCGAVATLALTEVDDPTSFGVAVTDADGRIRRFVEKPAPGTAPARTVNAGTYVLAPGVFDALPGDGPLSFEREVFPALVDSGQRVRGFLSDAYWGDLGTSQRYREGHAAVLAGRCRWPLPAGLRMRRGGVAVHDDARVAATAVLGPGTLVSAGASIGQGARLHGAVILEGARVGAQAVVHEAVVGAEAVIADGGRVGADAVLGDRSRVGEGIAVPPGARVGAGQAVVTCP